jgi:hypothetical protein
MSPAVWRDMIKPQYFKIYGYAREHGVLIMHHADSFCEPIAEDMVELGPDIWQGVLPQNDIVKLQKQLDGRMTLMGGIDAAIVDWPNTRGGHPRRGTARLRTYGPAGVHTQPNICGPGSIYPNVDEIISDEIERYNREVYASARSKNSQIIDVICKLKRPIRGALSFTAVLLFPEFSISSSTSSEPSS